MIEKNKKIVCYITHVFLVWWDNFKYKIKTCSQYYSRNRIKERNKEYFALQNKIKRLSERIANGEKIDIDRYEALKSELLRV